MAEDEAEDHGQPRGGTRHEEHPGQETDDGDTKHTRHRIVVSDDDHSEHGGDRR